MSNEKKHQHTEKDDEDLRDYYSYEENKHYVFQDPISQEEKNRRKFSKEREKQIEDFKRDADFYYKVQPKEKEEEMVHRDADRSFEKDKQLRKSSIDIVKGTEKSEENK